MPCHHVLGTASTIQQAPDESELAFWVEEEEEERQVGREEDGDDEGGKDGI